MKNPHHWSVAASITTVLAIIGLLVLALWGAPARSIDQTSRNAGSGSVAFNPGTDLVPVEAQCTDNHYIDSSIRVVQTGNKDYRQFATAVSIPYAGMTDAAVYKETSTEICGNPTELKMVADDMMLWSGFPGVNENKGWIVKIQEYIKAHGIQSFITKNGAGNLIVTPLYQKYAAWFNTVLLRFNAEGEQSLTSTRNWEQPATVAPGTQPVAVQATTQESKPSWVRTLRDKIGTCLYRIGFNAEDKRIETFNCVTPTPPKAGCTSNCGNTPGCTSNCTPVCPPTKCLTPKYHKDDTTPVQGWTPGPVDTLKPTPTPKPSPLVPGTPASSDHGSSAPAQGATPAPTPTTPAPVIPPAPTPTDPGTPKPEPSNG